MRESGLLLACIVHILLIGDNVLKVQSSPHVHGGIIEGGGRIPGTDDVTSLSVIDCSRQCTVDCQAFYYNMPTGMCRLVTSVFTSASIVFQNSDGVLDLYYRPGTNNVVDVQPSPLYVYAGTTEGRIPATDDVTTPSVTECGHQCTEYGCQAFYYERTTSLCRLVISVFTDGSSASMGYQNNNGVLDMYYIPGSESLLTSVSACPVVSGEKTTIVTPWSELTLWVYTDTMNHTQAWDACMSQGLVLMKIDTPEKQAAVRHVLNTCPVLFSREYWLDGFQNSTTGEWQYADGSLVPMGTTHFWIPKKPNGSNECLRTRLDHKWDDNPCDRHKSYICEPYGIL